MTHIEAVYLICAVFYAIAAVILCIYVSLWFILWGVLMSGMILGGMMMERAVRYMRSHPSGG